MGLFGFGKKKHDAPAAAPEPTVNRDEVLAEVESLRGELEGLDGGALANKLNEIGAKLDSIDDIDGAVEAYEKSLEANHTMGKASNALVKLYNKKRAAAAAAKNDAEMKLYLDKVNEMLALAKDSLRGRA